MKKLLIFGPNSIHVSNYLALIEDSFDEILVISDGKNERINKHKQEIISFGIRSFFENRKKIKSIKRIIEDFNPQIIHLHNIGTGAYLLERAVRKMKTPKIATAWGSDVLLAPKKFIFRLIVKRVLNNFDYFTADADFMAVEMRKLTQKNIPIENINFGVDPISEKITEKEEIIFSNRLHEKLYRIDKIIENFEIFLSNSPNKNWKLIIAGSGSLTDSLKMQAANSKFPEAIEFVGWLQGTDNINYYKKAKIYISIPESDGTSISLLEAMQYGCIPILSNLPANKEWVEHGKNGIIYSEKALDVIEQALNLNFQKLVDINQEIIEERALKSVCKFKFTAIYKKFLLIYF